MNRPVLVVMAAGLGSRYGGLKQLDPVGAHGELIIDYSLYDARRAGFETVAFVIKPGAEADFHAAIGARVGRHMDVRYCEQLPGDLPAPFSVPAGRQKPWGTATAVLAARHVVHGPFAAINADDYYGPAGFAALYRYLTEHTGSGDYCMAATGWKTPSRSTAAWPAASARRTARVSPQHRRAHAHRAPPRREHAI